MNNHARGVLYAEVLVAVAVLAIVLVPATNAIYAGLRSSEQFANRTSDHFSVLSRVEELSAEPFTALDVAAAAAGSPTVATGYSDPPGPSRRLVYLSRYDADNVDADNNPFTGTEADLMWLRVEIEGASRGLETLLTP